MKYYILLLIASTFLFASCNKDKKLEKTLKKADGVWNIDQVVWNEIDQKIILASPVPGSQTIASGTTTNAGTFTFNDGTVVVNFTINGKTTSDTWPWTVDNETITIADITQTLPIPPITLIEQSIIAYSGEQTSKDKITLEGASTLQEIGLSPSDTINQYVLTAAFSLTRK